MLTVGSLFSGIGGIDLAAEWAGMEVIWQCEIDPFCQQVLKKHWPGVRLYDDIREIGRETARPDVVVGGFPCQPFSIAGERRGKADDRDLWPEMFRVIRELKPTWVIGENVANFANMALERTLSDLESEGYKTQTFIIPACAVNAEHRRDRVFIVAYDSSKRNEGIRKSEIQRQQGIQGSKNGRRFTPIGRRSDISSPQLCRTYNGIPYGVDKIRALGNEVVPQQIYPIFKAIVSVT